MLLIIDNDESFAEFLLEMAHENGFKAVIADAGAEGIALANRHRIDAITLDIRLPVIDGWRVLDRLKNDLETRHIPVYLITDRGGRRARHSARRYRRSRQADQGEGVARRGFSTPSETCSTSANKELAPAGPWTIGTAVLTSHAVPRGRGRPDPCRAVLRGGGPRAPSTSSASTASWSDVCAGIRSLRPWRRLSGSAARGRSPCMRLHARPVSTEADGVLRPAGSRLAAVKRARTRRPAGSTRRPSSSTCSSAKLPEDAREQLARLYSNSVLAGKKVLIVDDDIRNIFAITSVLERAEHARRPGGDRPGRRSRSSRTPTASTSS